MNLLRLMIDEVDLGVSMEKIKLHFQVGMCRASARTRIDQLLRMEIYRSIEARILAKDESQVQAASRMAGFSARAGKPSLGARKFSASFGNTMVRHF